MKTLMFLAMTLFLSSSLTYAQSPAYDICNSLAFANDKLKCVQIAQNNHYDPRAVELCKTLAFANDKLKCLEVSANKQYDGAALNICRQMAFANDKLKCLSEAGQISVPCLTMDDIERSIAQALRDLRRQQYRRVEADLRTLQDQIRDCQDY